MAIPEVAESRGEGDRPMSVPPTTDPRAVVQTVAAYLREGGDESSLHAWLRQCFRIARKQGRREGARKAQVGKNIW